jgi:type VI secretion system protein ImpK
MSAPANAAGPAAGPADPAPARATLLEIASPLLATSIAIRRGVESREGARLRLDVMELKQVFERSARLQAHSAEDIADAVRALIVFLDESVLSMPGPLRDVWFDRPLHAELYGDAHGGEAFFTVLRRLRMNVHERIEALEVYLVCMMLGFEGRYKALGARGVTERESLCAEVSVEVNLERGAPPSLAPEPDSGTRVPAPTRELPWWYIPVVLVAALLVTYLVLVLIGVIKSWNAASVVQKLVG